MNEQLQQALASILNKTMAGVDAGSAFLQAELPDVIQQLLAWKLAQACAMLGFSILGIFLALAVIFAVARAEYGEFLHENKGGFPIAVCMMLIGLFSVLGVFEWGADAMQIWLAPKIYLIEYAASLAK